MNTTNLRRTPLFDRHTAAGGRMVPFAGFEMPVQYAGVSEEHRAVREGVGIFDVSHMGEVELRGERAIAVADTLFTNAIASLANGQACYTCMCLPNGGIIDDLVVYRMADDHVLICVNAANRDKDFHHMQAVAEGRCAIEDTSERWAQIAVQGPKAYSVVGAIVPKESIVSLKPFRFIQADVCGATSIVSRTGYTGEDGFELYVPADSAGSIWDALMAAGQNVGIRPAGLGARDSLRLEVAFALYGNDIDETTNPYEAGLGWVVKLNKPEPFIGHAALQREKTYGPARKLVGLEVTGRGIARPDYKICAEEGTPTLGRITSGTRSPTLGRAIALGYVQTPYAKEGTELTVQIRDQAVPARVVPRPFLKKPKT